MCPDGEPSATHLKERVRRRRTSTAHGVTREDGFYFSYSIRETPQSARKACRLSPAHHSGGRRRDPVSRRQGRTPRPLLGRSGSTRGVKEAPPGCQATSRPALTVGGCGGSSRYSARSSGRAIRHYGVESAPFQSGRCRHGNRPADGFALTTKLSP